MKDVRGEIQDGSDVSKVPKFSRRQVLRGAGIMVAGAALSSISLVSSCKSADSDQTGVTATSPPSIPITSPQVETNSSYVPPATYPPLAEVPGTSCVVATDRLYSIEHVWVKSLSSDAVVMGITSTMVKILDAPFRCALAEPGTILAAGDSIGSIEGWKLNADIITPVSGTLIEHNDLVIGFVGEDGVISALQDHYRRAWLVVVRLSNPSELDGLLSYQQYAKRVTGVESVSDLEES